MGWKHGSREQALDGGATESLKGLNTATPIADPDPFSCFPQPKSYQNQHDVYMIFTIR